jgi:hypothetical protein
LSETQRITGQTPSYDDVAILIRMTSSPTSQHLLNILQKLQKTSTYKITSVGKETKYETKAASKSKSISKKNKSTKKIRDRRTQAEICYDKAIAISRVRAAAVRKKYYKQPEVLYG